MSKSVEIARSSSCECSRLCCDRTGEKAGLRFGWEGDVDTYRGSVVGCKPGEGVIDGRRLPAGRRVVVSRRVGICRGRARVEEGR
jgi:hypothetical protein